MARKQQKSYAKSAAQNQQKKGRAGVGISRGQHNQNHEKPYKQGKVFDNTRKGSSKKTSRENAVSKSKKRDSAVRASATSYKGGTSSRFASQGSDLLEGRNALAEALDADAPIECIYASAAAQTDSRVASILKRAERAGISVRTVSNQELNNMSVRDAHQGVIAKLEPYAYASLQDLIKQSKDKEHALIIASDHITDAGNFGAICRTAEVVGVTGVLIPNKRNARVNANVYKTSAGAVSHLSIAIEANLVRSLNALKDEGFWIVGASEHATQLLWDANLKGRIVLVMGSEGEGLSRLTLETCDMLVALPQAGKIESLNVAQACTALSYEWMRQCR